MADPLCSNLFLYPVNLPTEAQNAAYRSVVTKPMDLTTLSSKLKDSGHYRSVQDWAADFSLIFDNAILFDQNLSYVSGVADYYKTKLTKFVERVTVPSEAEYATRLSFAAAAFADLLARPPSGLHLKSDLVGIDEMGQAFDEPALELLARKLSKLVIDGDNRDVLTVIPDRKPDSKGNLDLDVGMLSSTELKALWAYVREKEN
jgi:hypothetical protein